MKEIKRVKGDIEWRLNGENSALFEGKDLLARMSPGGASMVIESSEGSWDIERINSQMHESTYRITQNLLKGIAHFEVKKNIIGTLHPNPILICETGRKYVWQDFDYWKRAEFRDSQGTTELVKFDPNYRGWAWFTQYCTRGKIQIQPSGFEIPEINVLVIFGWYAFTAVFIPKLGRRILGPNRRQWF